MSLAMPITVSFAMPLDHWLAFVAASAVMLAIPGPTVLLVVSSALGYGRRPALAVVAGVALGGCTAMTASMLGLGAVLTASAVLFAALRWVGGAYLVYLGVRLWRAPVADARPTAQASAEGNDHRGPLRLFLHGYAVTALNPKGLVFFVAFVPQFMAPDRPFPPQAAALVATFITMDVMNSLAFATLASAARTCAEGRLAAPRVQRAVNRAGGSLLVGAGLFAAGWRRAVA